MTAQLITVADRWYAPPTLEWLLQWVMPEPNSGCKECRRKRTRQWRRNHNAR